MLFRSLLSEILPAIDAGRTVLREVDAQGFESIRNHHLFACGGRYPLTTIFILPESRAQLIDHITKRAPISKEELEQRLKSMDHELSIAPQTDIQIVNAEGKLDETLRKVEEVIRQEITDSRQ